MEDDKSSSLLAVLLVCLVVALPVITGVALVWILIRLLRKDAGFTIFLSHHKAAAGALCRLLTVVLQEHYRWRIFLDSDRLEEVTSLVDIVRFQTKCFVPVITQEYFRRPWCVAELTTAFIHDVPIMPFLIDGFFFGEDGMDVCLQAAECLKSDAMDENLQVSTATVKEAYTHVTTVNGKSKCALNRREESIRSQEVSILDLASEVEALLSPNKVRKSQPTQREPYMLISKASQAKIFICASEDPEANSTALVLQQLVQRTLLLQVHILQSEDLEDADGGLMQMDLSDGFMGSVSSIMSRKQSSPRVRTSVGGPKCALVLLSKGVLFDVKFTEQLVELQRLQCPLLPVNDGSFQFPSKTGFTGQFLDPTDSAKQAFRRLFVTIALPFSPAGTAGVLQRQVEQICQRTRDLGSKLPSPTEVDTSASASVAVLADAPSRSPTELVESRSLEEGSHFPQTVSTLPDRQLPVEIFDEYLFQSEDQEVEEYF